MKARLLRLEDSIGHRVPGAPYAVFSGPLTGTGPYRSDYIDVLAITGGAGRRVFARPDGTLEAEYLRPGQMFIFRPSDLHELHEWGPNGLLIATVAFPFATWERFVTAAELDRSWFTGPTPPQILFDPDDPDVLVPFEQALERFWDNPTALDLMVFLAAIIPLFVPTAPTLRGGAPAWLRTAMSAMEDEQNLRGGVTRLTDLAHVSPGHLWRCTRRYLGLTPTEIVSGIRLRHAALLLRSSDDPILAIAKRCGFSSPSYFSKSFRQHYGMLPRKYRFGSRT